MTATSIVYAVNQDGATRLSEIGVTSVQLAEALRLGLGYLLECTKHDVPSARGYLMYDKSIRSLRDQLVPQKWKARSVRNFSTVESPDSTIALTVAGGDRNTGIENKSPSTRREKGPAVRDAISINQSHFSSVDPSFPVPISQQVTGGQTWVLLHYFDDSKNELRAELSLPAQINSSGIVTDWIERIILASLRVGHRARAERPDAAQSPAINVLRRN